MKKIYLTLLTLVCCAISVIGMNASTNDRFHKYDIPDDYQDITVYMVSYSNDSTISYRSIPALYLPMEGSVVIGGSHYGLESNPNYKITNDPSSDFLYVADIYYTNLN